MLAHASCRPHDIAVITPYTAQHEDIRMQFLSAAPLANCNGLGACWSEEADRLMAKRWHRSTTAMNLSERQWHAQRVSSWPGVSLVKWAHYVPSSGGGLLLVLNNGLHRFRNDSVCRTLRCKGERQQGPGHSRFQATGWHRSQKLLVMQLLRKVAGVRLSNSKRRWRLLGQRLLRKKQN